MFYHFTAHLDKYGWCFNTIIDPFDKLGFPDGQSYLTVALINIEKGC